MALNGWHPGERVVRAKLGFDKDYASSTLYMHVDGELPPQHIEFHTTRLPFLPITTLDDLGRPWGSILAGHDGQPGFISLPKYTTLAAKVKVWDGDPLVENAKQFGNNTMLVAGIGIEFPTRRRNKLAGYVSKLEHTGDMLYELYLTVNEAIGNCPKYINVRQLIPHPHTSPSIAHRQLSLSPDDRLPDSVVAFILQADTVFFGTSYVATSLEAKMFPSHLGMNQRGGLPGFMRVRKDGRTVILPDFSGNRIMTSLGNVEATPLASLTVVSFTTGDILYITGKAKNLFGDEAHAIMARQNALTAIFVTGFVLVRDALPVRQQPDTVPSPSPYSPPVKLLVEESPPSIFYDQSKPVTLLLTKLGLLSPKILQLTWECSEDVIIKPGQAAILDLKPLLGAQQYQHMSPYNPSSVNDDRIRTWTVSSTHTSPTRSFTITVKLKDGGVVTTSFFTIATRLAEVNPNALMDSRPLELSVHLAGISGDFVLPAYDREQSLESPASGTHSIKRLLWVAGGIGVTPFLSMLKALALSPGHFDWDIQMVLSTREPNVLIPLLAEALSGAEHVGVMLHVFSTAAVLEKDINTSRSHDQAGAGLSVHQHVGRLSTAIFDELGVKDREIYMCGPDAFEKTVSASLTALGVEPGSIKREGFEY